jgi:hypothetical protein
MAHQDAKMEWNDNIQTRVCAQKQLGYHAQKCRT